MNKVSDCLLRSAYASKLAYVTRHNAQLSHKYTRYLIGSEETQNTKKGITLLLSDITGAEACVWRSGPRSCVVSFKGSSTCQDIRNFLNMKPMNFSFCESSFKMHSGVNKMFASIEPLLSDFLQLYNGDKHPLHITFCGHSLGGSLAAFAAAYYGHISNKSIKTVCHTFGAPRVGDENFIKWMNHGIDSHIHVVHNTDIIPWLPLSYEEYDHTLVIGKEMNWDFVSHHDLDMYIDTMLRLGYKKST